MDDPEDYDTPVVSKPSETYSLRLMSQASRWSEPLADDDKRPSVKKYAEVVGYQSQGWLLVEMTANTELKIKILDQATRSVLRPPPPHSSVGHTQL
jgi:hypothetical protein